MSDATEIKSKKTLPKIANPAEGAACLSCPSTAAAPGVGAVVKQYKRCGKPNCRCAQANGNHQHGPYYYRVWRSGGKVHKEYLTAEQAAGAKERCDRRRDKRRTFRYHMSESRKIWHEMNGLLRELQDLDRQKREILKWI